MEKTKLRRVSFSEADICLLNNILGYISERPSLAHGDYVIDAMCESIKVKSQLMQRILKSGVIEDE